MRNKKSNDFNYLWDPPKMVGARSNISLFGLGGVVTLLKLNGLSLPLTAITTTNILGLHSNRVLRGILGRILSYDRNYG